MRSFLFRRMAVDNKNYYQFYKVDDDFTITNEFSDFPNRNEKEFFYIEDTGAMPLSEDNLYMLFTENNNKLDPLTDPELFVNVLKEFESKYQDFELNIFKLNPIEEVEEVINKRLLFQKDNVHDLLKRLYLNQIILRSNLPLELKIKQKSNILLHGPSGNGKKTLVSLLKENMDIPFAEVSISASINETIGSICRQLTSSGISSTDACKGIVIIRDNFDELSEKYDDEYKPVKFLSNLESVTYDGEEFDFRTLTFIVLLDEYKDYELDSTDILEIMNLIDFDYEVSMDKLTNSEKMLVLMHKNGRIHQYEEFLKCCDKKLIVERDSLKKVIKACSKIDNGMNALNSAIDVIVKKCFLNGLSDVVINEEVVEHLVESMDLYSEYETKKEKPEKKEDIKKVIVENELQDVYHAVLKTVVGQDEHIKRILYTILENRRMANRMDLEKPKQYIQNILIRGETGGGKTLICNCIADLLNIPIFTADATQYTEAGYVGADITDMLSELYHAADDDLQRAQKGILVIDEVDKKAGHGDRGDVSRGAVLNGLLKIIEGAKIPINVGNRAFPKNIIFDTSRLTVVCSGAFENIELVRNERIRRAQGGKIGFDNKRDIKIDPEIIDKDYVEYGMQRQFMARLPVIVNLNKNTVESLKNIMLNSSVSALKIGKFKLEEAGFEIEYQDDFYDELAKEALALDIGARGIEKAYQRVLTNIHIEDINSMDVEKIVFTGNCVHNPKEIILVPKEKVKVK